MSDVFFTKLVERFERLEATLNKLDAATGDGDHGATMLKGLRAAASNPDAPAKAFRKAAGGASGSLFGFVVDALHKVIAEGAALPDELAAAAHKISTIGEAKPGDKTMLDALLPAAQAGDVENAAKAAREGCQATREMAARRGRAKHVEGAGIGHLDAGATSVAEMLEELAATKAQDS